MPEAMQILAQVHLTGSIAVEALACWALANCELKLGEVLQLGLDHAVALVLTWVVFGIAVLVVLFVVSLLLGVWLGAALDRRAVG